MNKTKQQLDEVIEQLIRGIWENVIGVLGGFPTLSKAEALQKLEKIILEARIKEVMYLRRLRNINGDKKLLSHVLDERMTKLKEDL